MTAADPITTQTLDLDAIRQRAGAATPGPWIAVTDNGRRTGIGIVGQVAKRGTGEAIAVFAGVGGSRHADAAFTANARDDVPALLDEVEQLRGQLQVVRDWVGEHGDGAVDVWSLREILAGREVRI